MNGTENPKCKNIEKSTDDIGELSHLKGNKMRIKRDNDWTNSRDEERKN